MAGLSCWFTAWGAGGLGLHAVRAAWGPGGGHQSTHPCTGRCWLRFPGQYRTGFQVPMCQVPGSGAWHSRCHVAVLGMCVGVDHHPRPQLCWEWPMLCQPWASVPAGALLPLLGAPRRSTGVSRQWQPGPGWSLGGQRVLGPRAAQQSSSPQAVGSQLSPGSCPDTLSPPHCRAGPADSEVHPVGVGCWMASVSLSPCHGPAALSFPSLLQFSPVHHTCRFAAHFPLTSGDIG